MFSTSRGYGYVLVITIHLSTILHTRDAPLPLRRDRRVVEACALTKRARNERRCQNTLRSNKDTHMMFPPLPVKKNRNNQSVHRIVASGGLNSHWLLWVSSSKHSTINLRNDLIRNDDSHTKLHGEDCTKTICQWSSARY